MSVRDIHLGTIATKWPLALLICVGSCKVARSDVDDPSSQVSGTNIPIQKSKPESIPDCPGVLPNEALKPWVPTPFLKDNPPWMTQKKWCDTFREQSTHPIRPLAEVAFIGDSITQGWTDRAPELWVRYFNEFSPLQLAITGDKTENLVWRIKNGALNNLPKLKVLVVMIGTNNIGWNLPIDECVRGILEVTRMARQAQPGIKILLLGVLPRDDKPEIRLRERIRNVNSILQKNAESEGYIFKDFGSIFLSGDVVNKEMMDRDLMHPNQNGYVSLGRELQPLLRSLIGKKRALRSGEEP